MKKSILVKCDKVNSPKCKGCQEMTPHTPHDGCMQWGKCNTGSELINVRCIRIKEAENNS